MNFASYAQFVILLGLFFIADQLSKLRIIRKSLAAQMCAGCCAGLAIVYAALGDWVMAGGEVVTAAIWVWVWRWYRDDDDDDDDRGKRLRRWVRSKFRRPVVVRLARDGVR